MQSDMVLWDKESNLWYNKTALKDRFKLESSYHRNGECVS